MPETKHQRTNRKWNEYLAKYDPKAARRLRAESKKTRGYEHPATTQREAARRTHGCKTKGLIS